jgi:predicted RNA-binding protein YlxR (DUF448 family)
MTPPSPTWPETGVTRGGRTRAHDAPERRCLATGESGPTGGLIRFVLDPEGRVVPDLAERLPGRGVWLSARRELLDKAVKRNLFARGFRQAAKTPADLAEAIEAGLARRLIEAIGLSRKAGLATSGFDKVRARLRAGPVAALVEARDGSEQGRAKLRPLAAGAPVIDCLSAEELGLSFGREFVIHAVLDTGGAVDRVLREARRLGGFRPAKVHDADAME